MTSNTAHTVLDSVDNNVNDIKGFDELSNKDKATVRKYFTSEEEKIAHLVEEIKNEKHEKEACVSGFSPANFQSIGELTHFSLMLINRGAQPHILQERAHSCSAIS
jgi:hypothetical protein